MLSIKANVILTTSNEQMNILWNRHWGVFEWLRYLNLKTKINIFNENNTLFNFENRVSQKTNSQQLINLKQNKNEYEHYTLNILNHSGVSIWVSKDRYNGNPNYCNWDGGKIAFIFIKKNENIKINLLKY